MKAYTALAHVIQDRNAAVAEVKIRPLGDSEVEGQATGSSKRENGEHFDEQVGADLALGRAFENLGKDLQRSAIGRYNALNPDKEPLSFDKQSDMPSDPGEELVLAIVDRVTTDKSGNVHIEATRVTEPAEPAKKAQAPRKAAKPRKATERSVFDCSPVGPPPAEKPVQKARRIWRSRIK